MRNKILTYHERHVLNKSTSSCLRAHLELLFHLLSYLFGVKVLVKVYILLFSWPSDKILVTEATSETESHSSQDCISQVSLNKSAQLRRSHDVFDESDFLPAAADLRTLWIIQANDNFAVYSSHIPKTPNRSPEMAILFSGKPFGISFLKEDLRYK